MPAERLSMRQIRDVLRLCYAAKLPQRAVARSLGLSQGAVSGYLSRARAAGITWPLPEDLDDARLEALLFPPPCGTPADQRPMPDWAWVHHELCRPDVTLALLWEEYRAGAADGFSYSGSRHKTGSCQLLVIGPTVSLYLVGEPTFSLVAGSACDPARNLEP